VGGRSQPRDGGPAAAPGAGGERYDTATSGNASEQRLAPGPSAIREGRRVDRMPDTGQHVRPSTGPQRQIFARERSERCTLGAVHPKRRSESWRPGFAAEVNELPPPGRGPLPFRAAARSHPRWAAPFTAGQLRRFPPECRTCWTRAPGCRRSIALHVGRGHRRDGASTLHATGPSRAGCPRRAPCRGGSPRQGAYLARPGARRRRCARRPSRSGASPGPGGPPPSST